MSLVRGAWDSSATDSWLQAFQMRGAWEGGFDAVTPYITKIGLADVTPGAPNG